MYLFNLRLIFLSTFLFYIVTKISCYDVDLKYQPSSWNMRLVAKKYYVKNSVEIEHCLYVCTNYRDCHGFNYHRNDKTCMVLYENGVSSLDSNPEPKGDLIEANGWVFYGKVKVCTPIILTKRLI